MNALLEGTEVRNQGAAWPESYSHLTQTAAITMEPAIGTINEGG